MKPFICAILIFSAFSSHAYTCFVLGQSESDQQDYVEPIMTIQNAFENGQTTYMALVKKNGEILENFFFEDYISNATPSQFDKLLGEIDGAKMAIFSLGDDTVDSNFGQVTLTTGTIDASKADSEEGMLKAEAYSFGKVGSTVILIDARLKMALTCQE